MEYAKYHYGKTRKILDTFEELEEEGLIFEHKHRGRIT